MKKYIIISHPGTQHSYWVALAMQETGRLDKYITSFYYKNTKFPYNLVKYIPRLDNILNKRFFKQLDQDYILNIPYYEIIERSFSHFSTNNNIIYWRDRTFDRHVSIFYINKKINVFIGYLNACYSSFKKIKKYGGTCILDMAIAYYKEAEILENEKLLNPEFADSINYTDIPNNYKKRINQEIELADYIVVASKFSKNSLIKNGFESKKIIIIPYCSWLRPIEKREIQISSKDNPLKVVYFGQLSQRKGIKYLLDAVKNLKNQGLNIELIMIGSIIGTGKWVKNYKEFFTYIPFVKKDKLRMILSKQDIFVFPSLFEGYGIVILDALTMGIPVITTKSAGYEAIEDNKSGFIIPIRNSKIIEEKLKILYNDRDLLYDMKINALERSKEFTFEKYKQKWIDFIRSL